VLAIVAVSLAATALAQRGGGRGFFGFRMRFPPNPPYDGAFQYCRGIYQRHPQGDGGGWTTDYPQADQNLPYRFSELTTASVSRDIHGNSNHAIVGLTDEALYRCPIVIMQEVGSIYLDEADAAGLRNYLEKGGFLWVDDFWGEYAWHIWETEIRKALPAGQFPMIDLDESHPMFHVLYDVKGVAQIPSIGYWLSTGRTPSGSTVRCRTRARFSTPTDATCSCSSLTTPITAMRSSAKARTARTSNGSPVSATRSASTHCSTH